MLVLTLYSFGREGDAIMKEGFFRPREYHRPNNLQEATWLLSSFGKRAKLARQLDNSRLLTFSTTGPSKTFAMI